MAKKTSAPLENIRKRNLLLMIAISFATVGAMADNALIPAVPGLFGALQDANVGVLNFILSGPMLLGAIMGLVSGKILQYISDRTLIIIGYACICIGAILGGAVLNEYFMAVMRAIYGIGKGIFSVTGIAIISKCFIDASKRGTMIGIYNAATALTGSLLGLVGGYLAMSGWRNIYYSYLVYLVAFVLIILFVPKTDMTAEKSSKAASDEETSKDKIPWVKLTPFCIAFFFYGVFYCMIFFQSAIAIADKNLGNAMLAGVISSIGTVGSFLGSLVFGPVFKKLKRATPLVGFGVLTLGYLMFYFSSSSLPIVIASFVMGAAFAYGLSYYYTGCTLLVPPSKVSVTIGITLTVGFMGAFMSTYVSTVLKAILKTDSLVEIIPIVIIALVIATVLSTVLTIIHNKSQAKVNP